MAELSRKCELCTELAVVYCPSDSAFLCATCDDKVHSANFLVARHVRVHLCPNCMTLDGNRFSGVGSVKATCQSCAPHVEDEDEDGCLSSSSSCVSSTSSSSASARRKRTSEVDVKVEGVLVNWCRKMDVSEENAGKVVRIAVGFLSRCLGEMTVLPFRVLLVTAFWSGIKKCCNGGIGGESHAREMERVVKISGVPAKLIFATESRLARVVKRKLSREEHVEGWAEC